MIFLFFALLLIAGCKKNESPTSQTNPVEESSEIFPLRDGYTLVYREYSYSSSGSSTTEDSSAIVIHGKTTIQYQNQNLEVYKWQWYDLHNAKYESGCYLVNMQSDGLANFGGILFNRTYYWEKSLMIKYPVSAGDSWVFIDHSYSTSDSSFTPQTLATTTCISTDAVVSTGIGNLHCYVYSYQTQSGQNTYSTEMYFSKGVGYVASVNKQNGNVTDKMVLKYTILAAPLGKSFTFKRSDKISKGEIDSPRSFWGHR